MATATSGVAAATMAGGWSAHSRFKIHININEIFMCSIPIQSGTEQILRQVSLTIWGEAPMAKHWAIGVVDTSLRSIMKNDESFSCKEVVFGGDLR